MCFVYAAWEFCHCYKDKPGRTKDEKCGSIDTSALYRHVAYVGVSFVYLYYRTRYGFFLLEKTTEFTASALGGQYQDFGLTDRAQDSLAEHANAR